MSDGMNQKQYLVRGALLNCDKGTHPRRLNLPVSHGSYVAEKPMISQSDCGTQNISYFGVCTGATPPKDAESVSLIAYGEENAQADVKKVNGPKCCPDIVGQWNAIHGGVVTTDSYLVCACGGLITPHTSGQEYND